MWLKKGFLTDSAVQLDSITRHPQEDSAEQSHPVDISPEGETIPAVRRSSRQSRPPERLTYEDIYVFDDERKEEVFIAASADPDTMYLHEARREPD